jgi:predicted phosphodiesterase
MRILLTSDWHFTDSIYDEYKWLLFPYLKHVYETNKMNYIFMLGDITEKKDNHSAKLVNRLLENIKELSDIVPIIFLQGNHDAIDVNIPFFKFLQSMKNVEFITKPTIKFPAIKSESFKFIPYNKNPEEVLQESYNGAKTDYILIHQPILNSITQTGHKLETGLDVGCFDSQTKIFAGDIHKPQIIGNAEYVGAPYHNYFGDNYRGQMIMLDTENKDMGYLYPDLPRKLVLDTELHTLPKIWLNENDQVKFRIHLNKIDYPYIDAYKKDIKIFCEEKNLILKSIETVPIIPKNKVITSININETPDVILNRFGIKENLNEEYLKISKEIINGNT